ncbi:CsgG/HfaB family protein [Opitutus sp. GAS368]|uniref:CsgG/HfaB family protein n=1 Tax=Opitutus sp. GAS368 TaxID=1882749 RepID=UPI00087C21BD|nr:CsgG/HfaB family protein [Opitutus sp. GAS368]SDS38954.1 Curli biogenesis system outer membrane secretion channel CsgG [Opitutus sp. GAS368]
MKTRAVFASFAALLCLQLVRADDKAPAAPAKGGLRYTITVTKFQNRSNYGGQFALADTFGAVLTDSLQNTGRFIVIAESDMRSAAMAEQDFAASGRAAGGDKAPVTGNMTPAQLLVKGEITNFTDGTEGGGGGIGFAGVHVGGGSKTAEINAVVYIVDSTTGQVKASKKVVGQIKSGGLSVGLNRGNFNGDINSFKKTNAGKAVEAAIDQAVEFCMAQLDSLPWTGNVILVKGTQVYFNRGEREGVTIGQVFKVGSSEVLRDPGTGEVLDTSFTEKAQIRVESVKEKVSICTLVSGSGIERGMAVSPQ